MIDKNKLIAILFSLSLVPVAVSEAGDAANDEAPNKKKNVCISARAKSFFSPITDEYLFVENGKRKYLLEIRRGCAGLRRGYNIAFKGSNNRVCSYSLAEIEYTDLRISMPSCRIESIVRVENWNEALGIIAAREEAKRESKKKDK